MSARPHAIGAERGIALMAVVVVLLLLVVIATPFSMSMRNQDKAAAVVTYKAKASQSIRSALALAEESLSATDPERDPTPQHDGPEEWAIDPALLAGRFGAAGSDPRGTIWSVAASDEQGKVDLNQTSPFLLMNLLGPIHLDKDLDPDETSQIEVSSTAGLPTTGLVWIDGELILYRGVARGALTGVTRAHATAVLKSRPAAAHAAGAPVLDYRIVLAAVYPYKLIDGAFTGFATTTALKDVARIGEMAFDVAETERLLPDLTVHAVVPGADRFLPGARVLADSVADASELFVECGRNLGVGSVVRIRSGPLVEYNLVTAVEEEPTGSRVRIELQEPLSTGLDAASSLVEPLARAPVNVNACSKRVLTALLCGLALRGGGERVDRSTAEALADLLVSKRPLAGPRGLAEALDAAASALRLSDALRRAILVNAENAADTSLVAGTAPFTYRSLGVFTLEAAVSENMQAGREAARLFGREILEARPAGRRLSLWSSQAEFEEAVRLSRTGKYWTTFPSNLVEFDRGNQPPLRAAAAFEAKRFAAADSEQLEFARMAPSRKSGFRDAAAQGAGRVIHFDERGVQQSPWDSDEIDGWAFGSKGPLALDVAADPVGLLSAREWVQPFAIDFWWQPGENVLQAESILLDSGDTKVDALAEIANRVTLAFDPEHTRLSLRVADSSVPDAVGSDLEQGQASKQPEADQGPLQVAQIQYDFDDGLAFDPTVPYHVSIYAHGTRPSDLALFIDGTPRGRRGFQTRLSADMSLPEDPGPFANIPGYTAGSTTVIKVEDARLFPPSGVLRIGSELIEYTSRSDQEFNVSPPQSDPFGGRVQRDSRAEKHIETEAVELYGYTAVVLSRKIPTGNVAIGGTIGKFGIAMVDPKSDAVKKSINIATQVQGGNGPPSIEIGKGIDETVVALPLAALGNPNQTSTAGASAAATDLKELFQKEGGFALLVSNPLPPGTVGNFSRNIDPNTTVEFTFGNVGKTPNGALIGLGELIKYDTFDGTQLAGVKRAPTSLKTTKWEPKSNLDVDQLPDDSQATAVKSHVHVFAWQNQFVAQGHNNLQPIYVIPISLNIGLNAQLMAERFPVPELLQGGGRQGGGPNSANNPNGSAGTRPEMVQIGVGFPAGGQTGTEWVRYDSLADGSFVRDQPGRIRKVVDILGLDITPLFTVKNAQPPPTAALERVLNFEDIEVFEGKKQEFAKDAKIQPTRLDGGVLAFRGVLGTGSRKHAAGDRVVPVFRTWRQNDVWTARPGPRDFVTLIDPTSKAIEAHRINFGYCENDAEGWGGQACHVALEAGLGTEFLANYWDLLQAVDPESADAAMNALTNLNIESRELTRMLKFPSGELPVVVGEQLYFGGDMHGEKSPAAGIVDEIEFFNPQTPSDAVPRHHTYFLSRDDELKDVLYVAAHDLRDNLRSKGGPVVETLDPTKNLPQDGVVFLIDDELIAVSEITWTDSGEEAICEIAVNGRGYLGTPIQYHQRRATVRELGFLRVSRLERSASPNDGELVLADAEDFEPEGVIQIGRELIGYTRKTGNVLSMPDWRDPSQNTDAGLFRGRFGTAADSHQSGALVLQWPARYQDRFRERADDPELAHLSLFVKAHGGFFDEVSWQAENTSPQVDFVVQACVGGRGAFTDDPRSAKDVFQFDSPGGKTARNRIARQGDFLELRVFTRWREGAFDAGVFDPEDGPTRGGSNEWKRAPRLRALGVDWISQPARFAYEEWR